MRTASEHLRIDAALIHNSLAKGSYSPVPYNRQAAHCGCDHRTPRGNSWHQQRFALVVSHHQYRAQGWLRFRATYFQNSDFDWWAWGTSRNIRVRCGSGSVLLAVALFKHVSLYYRRLLCQVLRALSSARLSIASILEPATMLSS
jgi:hypothetical protein